MVDLRYGSRKPFWCTTKIVAGPFFTTAVDESWRLKSDVNGVRLSQRYAKTHPLTYRLSACGFGNLLSTVLHMLQFIVLICWILQQKNPLKYTISFTAIKNSTPKNGLALYWGSCMCSVGPLSWSGAWIIHAPSIAFLHTKMACGGMIWRKAPIPETSTLCLGVLIYLLSDQLRNERILQKHRWWFGCSLILQLGLIRCYHQKMPNASLT